MASPRRWWLRETVYSAWTTTWLASWRALEPNRGSLLVEGGDDLLLDALQGFDITEWGEHDLLDTGVGELADSIDDVISRPCHRPGAERFGGTLASLLLKAGHEVVIANSRGPESLGELVAKLGISTSFRSASGGPITFVVSQSNHRPSALRQAQVERMIRTAISRTRYKSPRVTLDG